jgi:hypothetical protein
MIVTASDFKSYFDRGQFSYGSALPAVRDTDITKAIAEAGAVFNPDIYSEEATREMCEYYLTAHFLQSDIDAVDSSGGSSYPSQSRSADGISESNLIPHWMQEGEFAFYATTCYGQKFLILSKPCLDGGVSVVAGATTP